MNSVDNVIPDKEEGVNNETSSKVKCPSNRQASLLFIRSANRLLNINKWHTYSGKKFAEFSLTDSKGVKVNALAKEGYNIKIDIPGPSNKSGGGTDWVTIEKIEYREVSEEENSLAMRVRPAKKPINANGSTAHFFQEHATSTFLVIHKGNIVTCAVIGRNEKANIDMTTIGTMVRNMLTALVAFAGFSKLQWKTLTRGILCR
ncbi:hypothetical protein I5907_17850 [Panacibacter sp. DH6]|uniref:Uncharacterized protein n=1 Tax=Panacibacter microcysteis TaxID=2793269 RepID=A0A931GZ97_9BACT|nr:hypothetical protein [Panacibacter microcysteis]MBG9378106.1 hypothetical protein [Panacibacter microcysteis]